ncbi:MAG: thiamine phosphate synthase [Arcobacteraceae bacterium]|nr:thiamine phosphate synthase [Arcobacteraceae bacterium]
MLNYLITDPQYYTSNPVTFKEVLTKALENNKVDIACFRDKISDNSEQLAKIFIEVCQEFNIQTTLINSNLQLALKLKATGVHLTSNQFDKIQEAKQNNMFVIISCHSLDDIKQAQNNKADMVTYSSVFDTPNKGKPKGCDDLANVVKVVTIPVIALGGIISRNQIKQIKDTKAKGFASIRYFIA